MDYISLIDTINEYYNSLFVNIGSISVIKMFEYIKVNYIKLNNKEKELLDKYIAEFNSFVKVDFIEQDVFLYLLNDIKSYA